MDFFKKMIGYPKSRGKVAPGKCINLLLLGETGVGKSTFINSFVNYCTYQDFNFALKNKPLWIIPTKFSVFDSNMTEHVISIGTKKKDKNEYLEEGTSSTQGAKSYVFPMKDFNLRIIDTPGMGDTRGIDQDKKNIDNILDYLGGYEKLHAIMILLKPNQNKLTVWFEYCIQQLLSQLDKTAANNLVFVFTYSRSTLYKPGESAVLMKKFIQKIKNTPPYVEIPFSMKNIFCLDNEAYRFFLAYSNGIKFLKNEKLAYAGSWDQSVNETARLLEYVSGNNSEAPIIPHIVQNTLSVNEARRIIYMLSKPLADTANLINDNKRVLKKQAEKLKENKEANVELSAKLYIPCVKLKLIELDAPTTVCASDTCVSTIMMEGVLLKEYNRRCHDPCQLKNVPKEIIGSPELCDCAAMLQGICKFCECPFTTHMHIYYMSERYNDQTIDSVVEKQLQKITSNAERYEALLKMMKEKEQELDKEHQTIMTYSARFAHFLTNNCILPINDAYETYVTYLMNMEKQSSFVDFELIKRYEESLRMYHEEKSILERAQRDGSSNCREISPKEIIGFVKDLFKLTHMGDTIKMLYQEQNRKITDERHKNEEYVCEIFDDVNNEMADMKDIPKNIQHEEESAPQREENNGITTGQYSSEPCQAGASNLNTMEPKINNGHEVKEEFSQLSLKSEKDLNAMQTQVDACNEIVKETADIPKNIQHEEESAPQREENNGIKTSQYSSEPSEAGTSNNVKISNNEIVEETADIPNNIQQEEEFGSQGDENSDVTTCQYPSKPSEGGTSNLNTMEPKIKNGDEIVNKFSDISLRSENDLSNMQPQVANGNEIVEKMTDILNNIEDNEERTVQRLITSFVAINQNLLKGNTSNLKSMELKIYYGAEIVKKVPGESFDIDSDDGEASVILYLKTACYILELMFMLSLITFLLLT